MFESLGYGKKLDEELFESWLENGRNKKMGYHYLLIIWNSWEEDFVPRYVENREDLEEFNSIVNHQEKVVAVYDLYSESRISMGI